MKDKFSIWSLPILWIFSFLIMTFIMVATVHAESYFPMVQNDNGFFSDSILSDIDTIYSSDTNYLFVKYDRTDAYGRKYFSVLSTPKTDDGIPVFGELNNDGYRFSIYFVGSPTVTYYGVRFDPSGDHYSSGSPNFNTFQNLESSLYSSNASYVSNFRLYNNNTDSRVLVLSYGPDDPVVDVGVAIIPPDPILPDFDNLTPPSKVPPTYNTTDYTWTTPPTFDGSSVENALGSIQNVIGWLANNLKEEFKNLTDNLEGFFKYIGETIQYYAGIIIDTLNNFMTNFYDNMSALVQPIFEKIAYITEELDVDEVNDAFNNTSFIGLKNQFTTVFTTFETAFDISEPSTFTLTINIQNIDTFYNFGCRSPVIIHLDDHFIPIRTALRTFLWIFISFGTVFIVERGLSDWLRGENDTK